MSEQIKKIVMADGTELDATAFLYMLLSSKGNLQITSPEGKSINIESNKHLKVKPGSGGQIEILCDHTGDLSEVLIKALVAVDASGADLPSEIPVRFKFNCTEAEYNTKDATDVNPFDMKFKTGLKESKPGEHYCQVKLKGRSFDFRCYEHGGIALQPAGRDHDGHENKIKFETDRMVDVDVEANASDYAGEGGKGIEIGTVNSQFTSFYTKEYRFRASSPIFAVTRGPITETSTGKFDYPTQADDSKDIKNDDDPITWGDLVAAVKYLKGQGVI